MHLLRHMLSCLLIAVVFAISVNGVAMAANSLGHQTHCVDTFGENSQDAMSEHAHDHEHDDDGLAAQHATPGHDHETCMIHACPALSNDAIKLRILVNDVFTKLSLPEQPLHTLELADGLKRPPKS